jgi:hypothetical protein
LWGDRSKEGTKTYQGQPDNALAAAFVHTYGAARSYALKIATVGISPCGGSETWYWTFTLAGPSVPVTTTVPQSPTAWGFDTASVHNQVLAREYIQEVETTLGFPEIAGQYLEDFAGSHEHLTSQIASAFHKLGVRILVISSPGAPPHQSLGGLTSATRAARDAAVALTAARDIHLPKHVAIFRDIEAGSKWHVSAQYLLTWDALIHIAGYVPGYYENPNNTGPAQFSAAFCKAARTSPLVASDTILYSTQPQRPAGTAPSDEKPSWAAAEPACANTISTRTIAWQYYLNYRIADKRMVDVDEVRAQDLAYLW